QLTTDASGSYAFGGLGPGTYAIQQVLKPGYSAETATRTVTVQSGVTTTDVDLADLQVASISGTVFQDTNGDGVRQSGEAGVTGITLFLGANGKGVGARGRGPTSPRAGGRLPPPRPGP